MSALKISKKREDAVAKMVDLTRANLNNGGGSIAPREATQQLISLESLSDRDLISFESAVEQLENTLAADFDAVGLESFSATTPTGMKARNIALAAGAVAALAAGNPVAYAKQALSMEAVAPRNGVLVDFNRDGTDYRDAVASQEAFDQRELENFMPYSIAFNVFASRQDDFSEKFYPTTVVTPDQGGCDVSVSRVLVFNEVRHAITGKQIDFGKKNLIDAAVDHTVLADQSTKLVPYRNPDDSTAGMFIAEASHGGSIVKVAGVDVPTAPLAMGLSIDVLGLSQYTPLIGAGVYDNSDAIDANMGVEALYLIPAGGAKAVKFATADLPRSAFVKSVEGNGREMSLTFKATDLVINKDTKAIDGSAVLEFASIVSNDYTVHLSALISGTANVETGNVQVYSSPVSVLAIYNPDGTEVSTAAGAGATLKAALEAMPLAGYDLRANRTNSNRRTRGLMLDTTYETERYQIPLGAPITVPAPATGTDETADLKALIAAARQRNSNNAVTALFQYADQLAAYVKGPKLKGAIPNVQGMGRYLVTPFFERHTLDLEASINSIKSHEKAADVSSVLVNAIRDIAYRMYRDSRIQAALDQLNGGAGETPTLLVGTDQVLIRHLMVSGDTRTFGTVFDSHEVVASQDARMRNKIVLTFARSKADGPDPLSFGTHAWIPELTSTMQVNRNGATIKETMVQPRTRHFNNLPVMAVIDVLNLSKVLADKITTPATDADTSNPYLTGFMA